MELFLIDLTTDNYREGVLYGRGPDMGFMSAYIGTGLLQSKVKPVLIQLFYNLDILHYIKLKWNDM